jgi:DNA-binding transcriptional regulator YiaG
MAASAALFPSEIIGDSSPFRFYSGPIKRLPPQDRHFVRSLEERFPEPPADEAARVFGQQVVKLRSLHSVGPSRPVSSDAKHATERRVEKITKPSGLPELLSAALKRRMTPTSGLTDIMLAHALGVSRQTVWTWLNGINQPKGHHLVALINFFDASFANEILGPTAGCTVAKLCDARASALLKVAEGLAELKAMEAGR